MIKRFFVAVLLLAALVAFISVVVDYGSQVGAFVGLLLGTLLGPVRIAGVDFRQWFKDPGTPSELGDDSPIGLMRLGFHNLAGAAVVGVASLVGTVSLWMPQPCTVGSAWTAIGMLPWGEQLMRFLSACSGFSAGMKVAAGAAIGVVAMLAAVDVVWRLGLSFGSRPPAHPARYLAADVLPRLRRKEYPPSRRLIVCCDGTWNWPEARRETNVVRLVRTIASSDNGIPQIVHYHQGVGTGNFVDRIAGGGAGVGLSASVKACYGFIVDNYDEHSEIFLFGFSRGAYVARALGGLIGTIGIMRKHEMDRFAEVWNWYWQSKDRRIQAALDELAPERHRDVEIECIGVWDTVGALGIPGSRFCAKAFAFHETELGCHVRHAFQALAIDEKRGNFQAAIWVPFDPHRPERQATLVGRRAEATLEHDGPVQVLEQVWFPGVHSNIGGGYERHGCSDTAFLWMLSALEQRRLLGLNERSIVRALDPKECYPRGAIQNSRSGFWSWIFSPVPRPIGIISKTEKVHESAWKRRDVYPRKDIYVRPKRLQWLDAMNGPAVTSGSIALERTQFEESFGKRAPPEQPQIKAIPKKLDLCSRLLQFVNPRA